MVKDGGTALFVATQGDKIELMTLLLRHKADPSQGRGDGATPCLMAANFGCHRALQLLVDSKAAFGASTPFGLAEHAARKQGHLQCVAVLEAAKAALTGTTTNFGNSNPNPTTLSS